MVALEDDRSGTYSLFASHYARSEKKGTESRHDECGARREMISKRILSARRSISGASKARSDFSHLSHAFLVRGKFLTAWRELRKQFFTRFDGALDWALYICTQHKRRSNTRLVKPSHRRPKLRASSSRYELILLRALISISREVKPSAC